MAKDEVKRYYSELSEIIRTYIEDGLGTPAMEIPTKDIIEQLYQKGIDTNALKILLTRGLTWPSSPKPNQLISKTKEIVLL